MADQVQEIKDKLNVVDVISGHLRLNKAGVNYRALCPFHNEKTPSFMVSPSRQNWHCFGCGEGGDIFTFIEKIEGIEFVEALKILAEKAGVVLERGDPKLRSEKDRAYEICEKAAQFFTDLLNNPANNIILSYLRGRGLKDKTIEEWRLGYAPDSWDSLLLFLKTKGYKDIEIERAGLILKGNLSKYHNRFRNRLMFPIFDMSGRVVAFSGRIMHDIIPSKTEKIDSGKYINSPETILYSKSRVLYGLNRAKTDIRKSDKVILAEGQMDAILPWQDGVGNIVATSGTALTEEQLLILKRLTGNLVLAFDMDEAGFRATKRGVDLAQSFGFNISVVSLPEGKDPADFVKENPGAFSGLIASPEPIMKYYFEEAFKKFDQNKLEGKKLIALNLLFEIKRLPSAIERSHWIRELSLKLDISEVDLKEEMEQLTLADDKMRVNTKKYQTAPATRSRKEVLSEKLLALLLKKPELIGAAAKAAAFLPKSDLEIFGALVKSGNFSDIRSDLPQETRARLDFLYLAGDYEMEKLGPEVNFEKEAALLTNDIEREHYRERLAQVGQEIKRREAAAPEGGEPRPESGRGVSMDNLIKEFQNISKKIYETEIHSKKT